MKKTLLLTAMLTMCMAMMAQTPVKSNLDAESALKKAAVMNQQSREANGFDVALDSVVYTSDWDSYSNAYQYDWQGRNIVTTSYAEYGFERLVNVYEGDLLALVEHWDAEVNSGEWNHYADEQYTYDDKGNLTLFEYNALNFGEWGITDRYEYEYDEQDRLIQQVTWWYDFWCEEPQLELSSMFRYEYTETGFISEGYNYWTDTQEWEPTSRSVETYSPFGDIAIDLQMSWDYDLQDWVEEAMNVNEYDAEGHITCVNYSQKEECEWELVSQFVAEYNELGQLVATTNSDIWMTGELSPYTHDEYEYDENGNRSVKHAYWYSEDEMVEGAVYECLYEEDDAANIAGCQEVWDNMVGCYFTCAADREEVLINNKWLLGDTYEYDGDYVTTVEAYYSATTGVDENGNDVKAKIHGTQGKVVVSCDSPIAVSVYDMVGRQVAVRSHVSDCEINLTAGIYVVRAGDAAVKVVVR